MLTKSLKKKTPVFYLFLLIIVFSSSCKIEKQKKKGSNRKPNIIYILADDLGYGDLSCYGQQKFNTPNIDELAANGMMFTQHYAGCTVCAPSRCSLLTGLHTGHSFIRGNKEVKPEGQWPMPDSTYTLAEMLKEVGYTTGAFGKWGLGYPGSEGDPNNQGFDEFFGYNCQRFGHNYYPYYLWRNQQKVVLTKNEGKEHGTYGPDIIHEYALKFIEDNSNKPFFMYYPSIIPHAELFAREEYMEKYRGKLNPEKYFKGIDDGPKYKIGGYGTQTESHAAFAAMINILDDQVGEIVAKIKELGIEKNTIIILASDNGPHKEGGADPDYFSSNGPLKGYKRDLYEGGIRVPMIVYWPGMVTPDTKTEHISAFWDVFPTLADIVGITPPDNIDGISFLPTLLGKKNQKQHEYLYWEFHELGGRKALRKGDWKLVCNNVLSGKDKTIELYNLKTDIGEEVNLAESNPEKVREILELLNEARTESELFQFEHY